MQLTKVPFQPSYFINNTEFSRARHEFYMKAYVGKVLEFNCDMIGLSGSVIFKKGEQVKVRGIGYDWFNISHMDGKRIEGLYSPEIFNEVIT